MSAASEPSKYFSVVSPDYNNPLGLADKSINNQLATFLGTTHLTLPSKYKLDFIFKTAPATIGNNGVMRKFTNSQPVFERYDPVRGQHLAIKVANTHQSFERVINDWINIRCKISELTTYNEKRKFATTEEYVAFKKTQQENLVKSYNEWMELQLAWLLIGEDEIKKNVYLSQFYNMYIESDGSTNGYNVSSQMLTLEQVGKCPKCIDDNGNLKPVCEGGCCVPDGSCCQWKRKVVQFKTVLTKLHTFVKTNELEAPESKLELMAAKEDDKDWQKLDGLIKKVAEIVDEIHWNNTYKYAIGINCTDMSKCEDVCKDKTKLVSEEDLKKVKDYEEWKKVCSLLTVDRQDLYILMHPKVARDYYEFKTHIIGDKLITGDTEQALNQYWRVGGVVFYPYMSQDKIMIIHKDALNIYIVESSADSEEHKENKVINHWIDLTMLVGSFGLYPCITVKKKSS